jgi:Leucine rich repeat
LHSIVLRCVVLSYVTILFVTPGLSTGKTVWSTAPGTWSGSRKLAGLEEPESDSFSAYVVSESMSVRRSLYTTQPSWCSFQGVTCGSVSGTSSYANVLGIDLNSLALSGTIPSSIGSLLALTRLILYINSLTGSIPPSISSCTGLTALELYYNSLKGTIPASIGSVVSLRTISLHYNSLTGTIPTAITALTSLTWLRMEVNSLKGQIPSGMSHLTLLQLLYLQVNYLTMGSSTVVPTSTFSAATSNGFLDLDSNCLVYRSSAHPSQNTNATHCSR